MTWATDLYVREEMQQRTDRPRGGGLRPLLAGCLIAAGALCAVAAPHPALSETSNDVAGLTPPEPESRPAVPTELSQADVARYAKIFRLQRQGHWPAADREIARLQDRILMGYVLFQRYMHPTAYRSKYGELKAWLDHYADHPEAGRIYRLALRRKPGGVAAPRRPTEPSLSLGRLQQSTSADDSTAGHRGPRFSSRERDILARIDLNLSKGRPTTALHDLQRAQQRRPLSTAAFDTGLARIASSYFFEGVDKKAFALARRSAERSRRVVESADWIAGLAAWRLHRLGDAQRHFEALARSSTASPWNAAAGGYWAARAYLVGREPRKVNPMLALAAAHPRTFYGLLAARWLDKHIAFDWQGPQLTSGEIDQLMKNRAIRRVVALAQVGRHDLADLELRGFYLNGREALGAALVGLANVLRIPATQLRLARSSFRAGGPIYDAALFPMPPWQPQGGYQVDRALIYALMRQESGFEVKAKSQVGARGLMQIMPRTASYVANDSSLKGRGKDKLLAPEFNIEIGQRYLDHLLKDSRVRGNLIYLAVGYNSGPGNLSKWLKTLHHEDDPLLFMESIPSRETRFFVERVLTNFWIYRMQLNQDTPSLDAVAVGLWPYYLSQDGEELEVAQGHGRN